MLLSVVLIYLSWILASGMIYHTQFQGEHVETVQLFTPRFCPKGYVAYSSNCYALYRTPATWMDANIACQKKHSGHLVSVLTGSEASFLSSLINNTLDNYYDVWIGLHDPTEGHQPDGGGWEWSSTEAIRYVAWELNVPTIPDSGFCGSVTKSSGFQKWKDYNCELKLPFVCKVKY